MHKPAVHAGAEAAGEVIRRRAPIQAHYKQARQARGMRTLRSSGGRERRGNEGIGDEAELRSPAPLATAVST